MKNMYPLKLERVNVKTIWQNDVFAKMCHQEEVYGSNWSMSAHKNADNTIINGEFKGQKLSYLLDTYPSEMLGKIKRSEMLRIGFLDAKDNLSIQVHPYDEYAHIHENDEGKIESWYVVKAEKGAKLVAGTTAKNVDEIKEAVKNDKIQDVVKYHEMQEGDFILIDSGTLHALGAGILALEIGQNSDTTYRFYDYHRKDKDGNERELHLEKCYDVVDCDKQTQKSSYPLDNPETNVRKNILDIDKFDIDIVDVDGDFIVEKDKERFYCLTNVQNDLTLEYNNETMDFNFGEAIFIPAVCDNVTLHGKGRVLISYVK